MTRMWHFSTILSHDRVITLLELADTEYVFLHRDTNQYLTVSMKNSIQVEGEVLQRAGVVASAAAALTMMGGKAFASENMAESAPAPTGDQITYADAYHTVIQGGEHAGTGAAMLVAGAWTGVAQTPAMMADSLAN